MKDIISTRKQEFSLKFEMTESEARALHEITKFGNDAFLKVFYEKLGKSTLHPYEKGLISLFDSVRSNFPRHFTKFNQARAIFSTDNDIQLEEIIDGTKS